MKSVTRWIAFDLLAALAEGTLLFSFIFLLRRLYKLTDLFVTGATTLLSTFQLLFALLPTIMLLTFPMAILLASLMVYGRLAQDNELTALQAAGYSARQLLVPALLTGLLLTALLLWWANRIAPKGLRLFKDIAADVLQDSSTTGIRPGRFNLLGGVVIVPQAIDASGHMRNVRLFEQKGKSTASVIAAPTGSISYLPRNNSVSLTLEEGNVHNISAGGKMYGIDFKTFDFSITISQLINSLAKTGNTEYAFRNADLRFVQESYQDLPDDQKKKQKVWFIRSKIEMARRHSLPFACLIMALLGALLGMSSRKGKRSSCYAMTLFIIFLYYILLNFGKTTAKTAVIPVWLCLWIPNLAAMVVGIFLYYRSSRV